MKKFNTWKNAFFIAVVLILLVQLSACSGGNSPSPSSNSPSSGASSSAAPPATTTPPAKTPEPVQEDIFIISAREALADFIEDDYDSTLSYDALARNTDDYRGKLVRYSGRVLQISPITDSTVYRVAVDGNSSNVLWAEAIGTSMVDAILNDDMVVVYGVVHEETSYEATSGARIYLPSVLAVRIEKVDTSSLIEHTNEPFTITEVTSRGEIRRRTTVESFEITSVESPRSSGDIKVSVQVIGQVDGYDYLRVEVKCYDEDGFILGTKTVSSSVSDGERFKIDDYFYAPAGTVRIEIIKD